MQVAPTTLEKLAFPRVLDALADRCQTMAGQALVRSLLPDLSGDALEAAHERTHEVLLGDAVSLGGVEDVRPLVEQVVAGGILSGPECLSIAYTMDAAASLKRSIALSNRPRLGELAARLASFDAVLRSVREQLDPQGEVRDDATPKLREIRRRLQPLRGRIRERMAQMLAQYAEYVQDPIVTQRRDRYVIPIKASSQSRVPGLVLDTSDSGATVFMEPAAVVPLNNELTLLELEERDEVRRILIALGQRLAFDPGLEPTLLALAELDLVVASARLAQDWRLQRPLLQEAGPISLPAARHPLIDGCVPNDVVLSPETPLLVLTGPNAGGKTVLLKTIGLAVLMAKAGLFVAADERGGGQTAAGTDRRLKLTLPALEAVLTDIGDEQSIEASLSTYAAHLTNLRRIVQHAAPGSLLLIDELGSGTDPDEGAALSQAILEAVVAKRAFGLVTTHLAPLKVFAARRPGVQNAAMRFDVERLRPTFELVVGEPGRSYALAIAERVGLDPALLERAEELLGPEGARLERLLETLEAQRTALQLEVEEARSAQSKAAEEAQLLREQIERLRSQEAAVLGRAAERADAMLQDTLARARSLRQTAKEDPQARGKALEAIQQLRRETRQKAVKLPQTPAAPELAPGAVVRVEAYGAEGPVLELRGDQLLVQLGLLKVEVPRHEAVLLRGPEAAVVKQTVTPVAGDVVREINLRGQRVETALEELRDFVHEAHALRQGQVRVLHGKGTGALRDAVRRYLKDERLVERFEDAVPYEGGHGVTVAYLRV